MSRSSRATFWRRSLIAVGGVLLVGAAAAWVIFPIQYQAFALLRVASRPPTVLEHVQDDGRAAFEMFKATQAQLIQSGFVMNAVLRDPAINRLPGVVDHADDQVTWLKEQLTVEYPGDNEVLRIGVRANSKDESIQLTDKLVEVYLQEVVEHEKQVRMANEAKLQRAYEQKSADYGREYNVLIALEKKYGTSGSEAAQLKKKMAMQDLNLLIAERGRIAQSLRDNDLEIVLRQARSELEAEKRTADMISRRMADEAEPLPLPLLEKKREFLQQQLAEVGGKIEHQTAEVASLESVSAHVGAKQEELEAARTLKNQLGAEVERIRIEHLAPERIVKLEDAQLEGESGNALQRNILCGTLAVLGLLLLGLGLVIGRSRPLESMTTAA
jgi:hypothetical protein